MSHNISDRGDYLQSITNRHAIIWEMLNQHISRKAQAGRMDVDQDAKATYPRYNFQGGPNHTEKESFCYFTKPNTVHKVFDISVDTEIVYLRNRAWWILHQVPGFSTLAPQFQYPLAAGPCLTSFISCTHQHHEASNDRPMRQLPEDESDDEYHM